MNHKSAKLKRKNSKKTRSKKSYRRRTRYLKSRKDKSKRKRRIMKGGDYGLSPDDIIEIEKVATKVHTQYMKSPVFKDRNPGEEEEYNEEEVSNGQRAMMAYTTAIDSLVNDIHSKNSSLDKKEVRRAISVKFYEFLIPKR